MNNIATQKQALVTALTLAITAPSEFKFTECTELAQHFAVGLSEFEIAAAKHEVLAQLEGYLK